MPALGPVEVSAFNGMLTHITCAMEASTCHHVSCGCLYASGLNCTSQENVLTLTMHPEGHMGLNLGVQEAERGIGDSMVRFLPAIQKALVPFPANA